MLGIELGRRAGLGGGDDLVVEDVPPVLHLAGRPLAAHDDDLLERLEVPHDLIDAILHRRGLALAGGPVDGDQDLRLGELHPLAYRLGREATEDDVVRRADPGAGEHRHHDLGDHRQVDPDDIARLDSEILQRAGEALHLGQELGIGDVALIALLAAPVEGDPLTPALLDMPVEAVVGDVQLAAGEPLVEGRLGVLQDLLPGPEPMQLFGLGCPPALRVGGRLLVDGRVFQQGLSHEMRPAAESAPGPAARPAGGRGPPHRPDPDRRRSCWALYISRAGRPAPTFSGTTGSTVRAKVELRTAANEAYQAAAAVARPK